MSLSLLTIGLVGGLGVPAATAQPSPTPSPASGTASTAAPTPSSSLTSTPLSSHPTASSQPTPGGVIQAATSNPGGNSQLNAAMRRAVGLGAKMGQVNPDNPKQSGSPARGMAVRIPLAATWQPGWGVSGVDVSAYQANGATDTTDWQGQWNQGVRFAYVKASEGNYYTNAAFSQQYTNSQNVGMFRGAYHFAIPNWSSGNNQANYFVQNGGGWSPDGITMPPVLDIEYNPYAGQTINGVNMGDTCYNMAGSAMVNWIADFSNTMLSLTGRRPMIYTTADWWSRCTGNFGGFSNNPLWAAAYNQSGPPLPAGWGTFSVWQYSSTGPFVGDSNVWNGDYVSLQRFATYGDTNPSLSIGAADVNATVGAPLTGVIGGLVNGGAYQNFQVGSIVWSPATGAQVSMNGAIRDAWKASGFESGPFGYPTTGQIGGLTNGGAYQNFQNGAIVWSPATGAQMSPNGPIRDAWKATGFESGPLGYPTSGVVTGLTNGGSYQNFQNGSIIWNPATGAQVSPNGPIRDAWKATGFESGPLGYPTSGVVTGLTNGGSYQNFQNGAIIWSTATGAQVSPNGPIRTYWLNTGAEHGAFGYPTSGQVCGLSNGGCYQNFQNGALLWSPATGVEPSPNGPIRTAWLNSGAERGPLAYPTTGIVTGLVNGGSYQNYQNGAILWSSATGAQLSVNGPIRTYWLNSGAERSRYGYPTAAQTCNGNATTCSQSYQGGTITWNSTTGVSG